MNSNQRIQMVKQTPFLNNGYLYRIYFEYYLLNTNSHYRKNDETGPLKFF